MYGGDNKDPYEKLLNLQGVAPQYSYVKMPPAGGVAENQSWGGNAATKNNSMFAGNNGNNMQNDPYKDARTFMYEPAMGGKFDWNKTPTVEVIHGTRKETFAFPEGSPLGGINITPMGERLFNERQSGGSGGQGSMEDIGKMVRDSLGKQQTPESSGAIGLRELTGAYRDLSDGGFGQDEQRTKSISEMQSAIEDRIRGIVSPDSEAFEARGFDRLSGINESQNKFQPRSPAGDNAEFIDFLSHVMSKNPDANPYDVMQFYKKKKQRQLFP